MMPTNQQKFEAFREAVQRATSALYTKVSCHGLHQNHLDFHDISKMFLISLKGRLRKVRSEMDV